jgi:hypothetical protein
MYSSYSVISSSSNSLSSRTFDNLGYSRSSLLSYINLLVEFEFELDETIELDSIGEF